MDDDNSRKVILRLRMEDLASIWASFNTDNAATLHADVSLRLYSTAEPHTEDSHAAQTVATQDGPRQGDSNLAGRGAARRQLLGLGSNQQLPELSCDVQLATTDSTTPHDAFLKAEPLPIPGPYRFSELSVVASPPTSVPQRTSLTPAGMDQSTNHLDNVDEQPPKRQEVGGTGSTANSGISAQTLAPTSVGRKCSGPDNDSVAPLAKRHKPSIPPKSSSLVFGKTQPAAASGPAIGLVHGPRPTFTEAPHLRQPAGPTWRSRLPSGPSRTHSYTTSTTDPEDPEPQKLPISRQAIDAGHQPVVQQGQSSNVECVACCKKGPDCEMYSNFCSHAYCSKCINRLFKRAVRDDSLWPPQCCKTVMPIESIEHFLDEDLVPLVNARQVEMSVPILKRTYCVDCSAFIIQENIHENMAICYSCRGFVCTCTECKEAAHDGSCKQKLEQDIQDLEILAAKEGWKKCSTCLMFVENSGICTHMT